MPLEQGLFNLGAVTCVGLLAYFLNVYRMKTDALEKSHAAMSASVVTRFELQKYIDDMRVEMQRDTERLHDDSLRMHGENQTSLQRIDDGMVRLHKRIDDNMTPRRTPK